VSLFDVFHGGGDRTRGFLFCTVSYGG